MKKQRVEREGKEQWWLYSPLVLLVILGMVWGLAHVKPAPPKRVVIAAGEPGGAYYAHAQAYARQLAREGIHLEVLVTRGSVENLALLQSGKADMALVQGGVMPADGRTDGLAGLGSLYYEPLWLFRRQGIQFEGRLPSLHGLTISIGPDGSGTQALVKQLLADNGLEQAATFLALPSREAAQRLEAGTLDAAFFVASPRADLVRGLIHSPKVMPVSFERAAAYARRYPFLTTLLLPEGAEDLERNLPSQDVKLLATTAGMVVRSDLHPAVVSLMMQILSRVHGGAGWFEKRDEFPNPDHLAFPLHPQAERYYKHGPPLLQRYLPFWLASFLDRIKIMFLPLLGLLLPAFKIVPPLYRWRMRSRIYRWYDKLEDVDTSSANDPDADPAQLRAVLDQLEREVRDIRVPLAFSDQLYHLRLHIDFVRRRVEEQFALRQQRAHSRSRGA